MVFKQCLSVCKTLHDFNMIYVSMLRYKSRSQGISYKVEAKKKIAQSTFWPIFPSLQKMHKSILSIFLLTKNIFYWIIRLHYSYFSFQNILFFIVIFKDSTFTFKFHLIRSLVLRKILQEFYFPLYRRLALFHLCDFFSIFWIFSQTPITQWMVATNERLRDDSHFGLKMRKLSFLYSNDYYSSVIPSLWNLMDGKIPLKLSQNCVKLYQTIKR